MQAATNLFKNTITDKIIFVLTIPVCAYWWWSGSVNVYDSGIGGALFEILWLPMVASIFVLPAASLILLIRENFNTKSLHLYALLISFATLLRIFFFS